jgi:hypothetical protein
MQLKLPLYAEGRQGEGRGRRGREEGKMRERGNGDEKQ